jgi:hypothetical protein
MLQIPGVDKGSSPMIAARSSPRPPAGSGSRACISGARTMLATLVRAVHDRTGEARAFNVSFTEACAGYGFVSFAITLAISVIGLPATAQAVEPKAQEPISNHLRSPTADSMRRRSFTGALDWSRTVIDSSHVRALKGGPKLARARPAAPSRARSTT